MRSGDLLSYLSMNCLLNGVLSCSRCYFVRIKSISQKFILCVTDGRTSYKDARTHLLKARISIYVTLELKETRLDTFSHFSHLSFAYLTFLDEDNDNDIDDDNDENADDDDGQFD